MRTRTRAVVAAAAAVATAITAPLAGGLPAHAAGIVCGQMPTGEEATAPPPAWVADLNTQRVAAGLKPVGYAPDLDEFARVHAVELLANPTEYSDPHVACAGDEVIGGGKEVAQAAQGLLSVPAHGDWLLAPGL